MVSGLISVIVPVYNCEGFLRTCIDSILRQSYTNFEIILIDDGSKDSSAEICDTYANRNTNVRVIHRENRGVAATREEGVKLSRGEYITFIDSDDYISYDYFEKLVAEMEKGNYHVVCSSSTDVLDDGTFIKKENEERDIQEYDDVLKSYIDMEPFPYTIWGKLFRAGTLSGITFPKMRYAEDTTFMMEYLKKNRIIRILNFCGYYYRIRNNSATYTIESHDKGYDLLYRNYRVAQLAEDSVKYCTTLKIQMLVRLRSFMRFLSYRDLTERGYSKYRELFVQVYEYAKNDLRLIKFCDRIFLMWFRHLPASCHTFYKMFSGR